MTHKSELIERLKKRLKEDERCAQNNLTIYNLLRPELDKFNSDNDTGYNMYAVRLASEYKQHAVSDASWANDLRQAIDLLTSLESKYEQALKIMEDITEQADRPGVAVVDFLETAWRN